MHTIRLGSLLLVVAAFGCSDGHGDGPTGTGKSAMMMITAAAGGTVTLEGTTLSVPPGALAANTQITITSTTSAPPATFTSWSSPVFKFEPDGLTFSAPVSVTMTFTGSPVMPAVQWSTPSGGFENRGGSVEGDLITASVTHFSQGFVAGTVHTGGPDGGPSDGGSSDGGSHDGGATDGGSSGGG